MSLQKLKKFYVLKFKLLKSKTRFFMDSNSPEWHSESEFYYPDEMDENVNTGNTDKQEQAKEKTDKQQEFLAEVHDFIEEQRPENTKKKTV